MDMHGKHVVITGPTAGIGQATALELARRGARLTLACRTPQKADGLVHQIVSSGGAAPTVVAMDLASLASARAAAAQVLAAGATIDVLINNAGLAGQRGQTRDGFELAFGTNHLGHFLLTTRLLPLMADHGGRIVTVSSRSHLSAKGIPFETLRAPTKSISGLPEYAVSKLCNVLFSAELGRRLAPSGIKTYSLHPGVVASDIWKRVPWPIRKLMMLRMISNEQGAATTLYCATSDDCAGETGLYYNKSRVAPPNDLALDHTLAALLWQRSEEWVAA